MNKNSVYKICFIGLILLSQGKAFPGEKKLGDVPDGSRHPAIHKIKLVDHDSSVIHLYERPLLPFSTEMTCGSCHDYQSIRSGWHFNAGCVENDGRNSQPWIYANPKTLTQIPLSYRNWDGAFSPDEIGMTAFEFNQLFGRHHPGGSVGDQEKFWDKKNIFRWNVSGQLEINCLVCHDVNPENDRSQYAMNLKKQNFRWATASTSSFANVNGSAKDMPDNYDIYSGFSPDDSKAIPPSIDYDGNKFNEKDEVFFDLTRNIPNENCYFCHSKMVIDKERPEFWQHGEDIHLKRGMNCVDCHRNGLDHQMVRGYPNEFRDKNSSELFTYSCEGCHLSKENDQKFSHNNNGQIPQHKGLPPLHFEKLSCTACHSGEMLTNESFFMKTSMAHALGTHGINKADSTLPHITTPVFQEDINGKISPVNMVWPSFWGWKNGENIFPMKKDNYELIVKNVLSKVSFNKNGSWPIINENIISKILTSFESQTSESTPVYISGGKVYAQNSNGLSNSYHPITDPYTWPIGHNVRPATMSLGSGGCTDCHSADSPFYTGIITVDSPLKTDDAMMVDFHSQNLFAAQVFSNAFIFRPWLKGIIYLSVFLILSLLALLFFNGLRKWIDSTELDES
tara:strand:- start:610 stop:2475 length:1866 start_codon:yes stop_codon:yes gene_type:complete